MCMYVCIHTLNRCFHTFSLGALSEKIVKQPFQGIITNLSPSVNVHRRTFVNLEGENKFLCDKYKMTQLLNSCLDATFGMFTLHMGFVVIGELKWEGTTC